jgi:hypothetical protein
MVYFSSRDVTAISICASLWGVLNSVFSPIFFQITGLPILCDLIGFSVLSVAVWWTRKFGIITVTGLVATGINFVINPGGIHFLGFTAAAIVFDIIIWLFGYNRIFGKKSFTIMVIGFVSTFSASVAGYLIGLFFMPTTFLVSWGGVLGWAGFHGFGGVIGGAIGIVLILSLNTRSIQIK